MHYPPWCDKIVVSFTVVITDFCPFCFANWFGLLSNTQLVCSIRVPRHRSRSLQSTCVNLLSYDATYQGFVLSY